MNMQTWFPIWQSRLMMEIPYDEIICPDCNGTGEKIYWSRVSKCRLCDGDMFIPVKKILSFSFFRKVRRFESEVLKRWIDGRPIDGVANAQNPLDYVLELCEVKK